MSLGAKNCNESLKDPLRSTPRRNSSFTVHRTGHSVIQILLSISIIELNEPMLHTDCLKIKFALSKKHTAVFTLKEKLYLDLSVNFTTAFSFRLNFIVRKPEISAHSKRALGDSSS